MVLFSSFVEATKSAERVDPEVIQLDLHFSSDSLVLNPSLSYQTSLDLFRP